MQLHCLIGYESLTSTVNIVTNTLLMKGFLPTKSPTQTLYHNETVQMAHVWVSGYEPRYMVVHNRTVQVGDGRGCSSTAWKVKDESGKGFGCMVIA